MQNASSAGFRRWGGRGPRGSAELDVDLLGLGERLQGTLEREFPTEAAGLVAAVGLADHLSATLIDLDPAGLDPVRGVQRGREVPRPDVGAEAEMRVVRHPDHVVTIAPGNGNQNRSEYLLLRDAPRIVHTGEDRRAPLK